jgi:hypothetical protein
MFDEVLDSGFGTGGAAFADTVQTATMPRAPINFMLVKRITFPSLESLASYCSTMRRAMQFRQKSQMAEKGPAPDGAVPKAGVVPTSIDLGEEAEHPIGAVGTAVVVESAVLPSAAPM